MERKQRKLRKVRFFVLSILSMCSLPVWSQYVEFTTNHDESKMKQWQSMEAGPWGFEPGWYYSLLHHDYSGAHSYFGSKFSVDKSTVGQIGPVRMSQSILIGKGYGDMSKTQLEKIDELKKEEELRLADRIVDLVYPQYKGFFQELQDCIDSNLKFVYKTSGGALYRAIEDLQDKNDVICEQIEYIHKQGIDCQIESTKRQIAYEEAKEQMTKLAALSTKLAKFTALQYGKYSDKFHGFQGEEVAGGGF